MKDPRRNLLRHARAQIVLGVLGVALLIHAAGAAFVRIDLTRDRRYTLHPASIAAIARLDRPLVATVYVTPDLEAPYHAHRDAIRDLLESLAGSSDGRLVVRTPDLADPEVAAEAERMGVAPVTYRYRAKDRAELKRVYLGVTLVYGDRQKTIAPIATLDTLEYEVVRAIRAVTTPPDDRPRVAILQGQGEPDLWDFPPDNPLGKLRADLAGRYDLDRFAPGGAGGIPENVDVVLEIGPQGPLSDRAVYQIDQFLMRGGSIALFISSYRPDFEGMRLVPIPRGGGGLGLDGWLSRLGVSFGSGLVFDRRRHEEIPMPVALGGRRIVANVGHPLVPIATDLDPRSPLTAGLDRAVFPFASPIDTSSPPPGVTVLPVARTGADAGRGIPASLAPEAFRARLEGETAGPSVVMATLDGPFRSAFAERAIPPPEGMASVPPDEPAPIRDGAPGRLVVVGSADFIANNPALVLNAIDWLAADPSLTAVRARSARSDRLEIPDDARPKVWAFLVGLPLLLLGIAGAIQTRMSR